MNTMRIGDVEVHRVLERVGPIKTVDELFPDTPADAWADVAPKYWTPDAHAYTTFPAHIAGRGATTISRTGIRQLYVDRWAPLPEI